MPTFTEDSTPHLGESTAPTTNSNGTSAANVKDSIVNNAATAANSVKNAQITQDLANGPMATSVKNQASATSNEFGSLAGSRATPSYTAANDTPLTHYHSFFYTLLSWQNPRATGITFAASILFIFACRYLPVISWVLRITWMTLGVVTLAEVAAKTVMGSSVTSSIRPRRYYTIPKETLESTLDDVEHLINFFVIEIQRIVFAENVLATGIAFTAAFLSYYLIKLVPMWGMALLSTTVLYSVPLIYIQNREFIDGHLEHAGKLASQQASQVRDLASQHAGKSFETVKSYTGEYANKAGEMVGSARQKIPTPAQAVGQTKSTVKENDFPRAPKSDLQSEIKAGLDNPSDSIKPEHDPVPSY